MYHLAFGLPGLGELWPILLIVVLLFGARKLPELARSFGSSITQFKKGLKEEDTPPEQLPEGAGGADGKDPESVAAKGDVAKD